MAQPLYLIPTSSGYSEFRASTYEEYLVSIGLSDNTVRAYVDRLRRAEQILRFMGADLESATAHQLAAMAAQTSKTHSLRGQLRCALKHFYTWQDRLDAPLRAVRVPPQPKMVNKALEPDETAALLAVSRGRWPEGAAVMLGLYLGLRRAEIAAAEWWRFDERMEWYEVLGKGDKTATVPVHPVVREELERRRGTGWVFQGRKNVREHISPATVWDWVKRLAREARIGKVTTHQLRHTALTTALDNTENLRAVMEFARHERPQTTAGYTRTTKEQLQRVSAALDYGAAG